MSRADFLKNIFSISLRFPEAPLAIGEGNTLKRQAMEKATTVLFQLNWLLLRLRIIT
jgi:hypothetical protein